jgi:hypothetical protein
MGNGAILINSEVAAAANPRCVGRDRTSHGEENMRVRSGLNRTVEPLRQTRIAVQALAQ